MLRLFGPDCPTEPVDPAKLGKIPKNILWIDLLEPTPEEEALAEKLVGTNIPTRDELAEIEPSSRLYATRHATYMTMSVLHGVQAGQPGNDPVGFILTDKYLISVRYIDPKPFVLFAEHIYAEPDLACDPRSLFVRLLDTIIDRLADEFQVTGNEIEAISRQIFCRPAQEKGRRRHQPELRLEALLMRIGRAQQLLAQLRESSVSATRLLTFLASTDALVEDEPNRRHTGSLIADAQALNDHSNFLGDNLVFLLDANLGFITLEQNFVMKVFSIFAVVFMPPTLIAGVYGMNFEHIPELKWLLGYPYALGLILLSAVVPFWIARRKGWL
ncbi:MAG: magnesium transporter CorA family protein [Sphingomicrobium sp.]